MVYLVGAGIGNAELITLKGLSCIKRAEVIVYDHLANPSLLSYASGGCKLIYAGKTAGNHHMAQEEINKTLVKYGKDKIVVRLKGGDPLVFGRGGEEIEELKKNNIEYELVPGVSSSYGAAEYAGIPVTHRGIAPSFHVITGHEKQGGESVDYAALARLSGTLVFLMGLGAVAAISENLINNGKNPETMAAIIADAAGEKQKCVVGTLKSLPQLAGTMQPPAVIVVGEVVKLQRTWYKPSQIKILTTGTRQINENIKRALGDIPVTEIPLIKITKLNYDKFAETDLTAYSYIAFTSAGGVQTFFEYLRNSKRDIRILGNTKFAAVGKKTADTLSEYGIIADIVPDTYSGFALAEELAKENCKNVLLIRTENGAQGLPDGLKQHNIPYTELALYKTEIDYSKKELLNLTAAGMDYIIFSSGSTARAFAQMSEKKINAKFIAIGYETAKTAENCGIKIYKTAPRATAECIAETILEDR